jgi:tRNA(Ile)-lysidine synthetase-like protein
MEYVNREEDSPLETQFLKDFCQTFQIPFVVRKINYMRRDEVEREFYEEETRKARFATYKYMQREHHVQTFCLGHHYGDLGENVLMNIFKGRDILDLFVMSETAVQETVNLSRPLLQHPKSDIYEYAHKNQIPYFKDTTPDWSCRGMIRRRIMPLLEEQWGECIHKTLAGVGKRSAEWDSVIETMVIRPFLNTVKQTTNSISFEVTEQLLEQPQVFWQRVLMELFHSKGSKMISNKNLTTMLEMLKKRYNSSDALKISLSNGWSGEFKKNALTINNNLL